MKTSRTNCSLTQQKLAERRGQQGRNTISNWEREQNLPRDREDVLCVAETLNLEMAYTNQLLEAASYATIRPEEEAATDFYQPPDTYNQSSKFDILSVNRNLTRI